MWGIVEGPLFVADSRYSNPVPHMAGLGGLLYQAHPGQERPYGISPDGGPSCQTTKYPYYWICYMDQADAVSSPRAAFGRHNDCMDIKTYRDLECPFSNY